MARQAGGVVTDPLADLLAYVSSEGRNSDFVIYDLRALTSFTVTPSGGWTTNTMSLIGSPLLKADGIYLNGSTQYGIISDFIGSETITVFARVNLNTTSPGVGTRGIVTQYDGLFDRSFYFGYNYSAGTGTRVFRSSDGSASNQEAYQNSVNTLPGTDTTAVGQWIDGGGRSIWHNKTAQSLSLFSGTAQTSRHDEAVDILMGAVDSSSPSNHLAGTVTAMAIIKNALTTTQRETITDFINLL
jgi:hypothetical protein